MEIFIRVKSVGRRAGGLAPVPYTIPEDIGSLRQLLEAVVRAEVARYNSKEPGAQGFSLLSAEELEGQVRSGKVGFGATYDTRKADADRAVENAVQCWKDGLVRIFLGEDEVTALDEPLRVAEGDVFTFLRLTFLAGRMW